MLRQGGHRLQTRIPVVDGVVECGSARLVSQVHISIWPHRKYHFHQGGRLVGRRHLQQGDAGAPTLALGRKLVDVDVKQGEQLSYCIFLLVAASIPECLENLVCLS